MTNSESSPWGRLVPSRNDDVADEGKQLHWSHPMSRQVQ